MILLLLLAVAAGLLFVASKSKGSTSSIPFTGPTVTMLPQGPELEGGSTPEYMIGLIRGICAQESYYRPELAIAIAKQESSLNPNARNPEITRERGDQPDSIGLMGIQFATAKAFMPELKDERDLLNPDINARCGVRYLKYLEARHLAADGLDAVIQMYNVGESRYNQGARVASYLASVKAKL